MEDEDLVQLNNIFQMAYQSIMDSGQQYGSDKFEQDSPRCTSSKATLYTNSHYIDSNTTEADPSNLWMNESGDVQPLYSGDASLHLPQPANSTYLPHNPIAYSTMSPNAESAAPILSSTVTSADSLSPMSMFRNNAAVANNDAWVPSPVSLQYSHSDSVPTTALSVSNTAPIMNQQSTTGDIFDKNFASINTQIFPTNQSVYSYNNDRFTPINSLPSLSGSSSDWATEAAPVPPHFTVDHNSMNMLVPEQQKLDDTIGFFRDHAVTRMEERLNDGINVLKNHVENTLGLCFGQVGPHEAIYSHTSSQLNHSTNLNSAVTVAQSQDSYFGLTSTLDTVSSVKESLPVTNAKYISLEKRKDLSDNSRSETKASSELAAAGVTNNSSLQGKETKRSRTDCSSTEDEDDDSDLKVQKEKKRRQINNTRERTRIKELNEALKELEKMCMMTRLKADKPQTKLDILNMAVEIITTLEKQIRERNINPHAYLKRRKEKRLKLS